MSSMTRIETTWRFLQREKTRHGKVVYYVRKDDGPRVRIHGEPGSKAFTDAYHAAVAGRPRPQAKGRTVHRAGTLGWLIARYRASGTYARSVRPRDEPATTSFSGSI
jgi:hypothetical protein